MTTWDEERPFDRRASEFRSLAEPVIIGGCGRSGTTLMRVILDSHRRICIGPESELFISGRVDVSALAQKFHLPEADIEAVTVNATSRGEFIDLFFQHLCSVTGKARWGEKTPRNVLHLDFIFRTFPNARFIHMLRDGRDVVCSLRTHPRHKVVDGQLVPLPTSKPIQSCIERWVRDVSAFAPFADDERCLEVRYEQLVAEPRRVLQDVCGFLDEEWDERLLAHHTINTPSRDITRYPQNPEANGPIRDHSVGRWREDLAPEEQSVVRSMAGALLEDQGYALQSEGW